MSSAGARASPVRYRFGPFVLSPARRMLLEDGHEVPLIPRYLDLLLLLVTRRNEAVSRRLIFDGVWSDVVVSDGALSQAVRTLRRALGDNPREPRYIRTVARHGYRFVFEGVVEEDDRPEPGEAARVTPVEPTDSVSESDARGCARSLSSRVERSAAPPWEAWRTPSAAGRSRACSVVRSRRWAVRSRASRSGPSWASRTGSRRGPPQGSGLGPLTRAALGAWEGLLFGAFVVLGFTHRR